MSKRILITAETGSDITQELAHELGVTLIPMHVSLGNETLDDGTFPPEDVCSYYDRTGKVPTTSGSTPYDFESVYDALFSQNPDLQILHLAYSAVTACSYHSCELAIEGKPYEKNVRIVDTKHVSVGQCAVVVAVGQILPGGGDDGGVVVVLADQLQGGVQLLLGDAGGAGEDDGGSGFDLVVVELTEVLHIDLHLAGIADSNGIT